MKLSETQLAWTLVETLEGASNKNLEQTTKAVIDLLASRNELHRLNGLIQAIEQVWIKKYGAATITIETSHFLSENLRKKLQALSQGAQLKEEVRPELIGGARLRVDETIIDGSIQGHLLQLAHILRNA
ncbi:MAG: hypothetical protein UT30_C0005G0030 [Candidatus Uhrbacteria bacterium GW2011_GWF2_39_13]|uniref:Uncharacterized protein n=1 Tax=Candidatus Uhrbacteria bacterium GW2011_GWF2_39_13 TaxID=1618995 RepID=A0A0G0QSQ5_9BACT|nr:MAG: hypothetical protein UT30_C0005G0030 [Candidatus Uhrbacteria bacterium GW2011_GWF2_39_13]HAU66449.1 hypothetical protein [Candidatus Uhrbacteria bacterium]